MKRNRLEKTRNVRLSWSLAVEKMRSGRSRFLLPSVASSLHGADITFISFLFFYLFLPSSVFLFYLFKECFLLLFFQEK
jgi:hypothetical protein